MSNNEETYEDAILRELKGVVQKNANSNMAVSKKEDDSKVLIYKFYADWCGPCKVQSRLLDEVRREGYSYDLLEINIEDDDKRNRELVAKYNVMSIPTLVFFKAGLEPVVLRGLTPKEKLRELL